MGSFDRFKEEVLTYTLWLRDRGYFGSQLGSGGNVSQRIPGEPLMAITPSSIPYDQVSARDIVVVDFDRKVVEGTQRPSMESGLHAAAYACRPDAGAVVHTHQPQASVLALINQPLPPLFDEVSLHLGPGTPVIPYAFSGSKLLAELAASRFKKGGNAFIIQNHGAVLLGPDLRSACHHAELLEKAAQIYLAALGTGKTITVLPPPSLSQLETLRKKTD